MARFSTSAVSRAEAIYSWSWCRPSAVQSRSLWATTFTSRGRSESRADMCSMSPSSASGTEFSWPSDLVDSESADHRGRRGHPRSGLLYYRQRCAPTRSGTSRARIASRSSRYKGRSNLSERLDRSRFLQPQGRYNRRRSHCGRSPGRDKRCSTAIDSSWQSSADTRAGS